MLKCLSSLIQLLRFRHLTQGCEQLVPAPAAPAERAGACALPLQHAGLGHTNGASPGCGTRQREGRPSRHRTTERQLKENELSSQICNGLLVKVEGREQSAKSKPVLPLTQSFSAQFPNNH